jgi:hypothetical protein
MLSKEAPLPTKLTTGKDLDEALTIAEKLLDQAERTTERCRLLYIAAVGVTALVAFALTGLVELSRFTGGVRLWAVWVIGILGAAAGLLTAFLIRVAVEAPLRKRAARDAKAAVEVVGLLRELMSLVADHERWSELQLLSFRTRVSRFPIGPGGIR